MSNLLARQCSLYMCTRSRYLVSYISMQSFLIKPISRRHFGRPLEAAFQHRYFQSTSLFSAENSSSAASKSTSRKAPVAPKPAASPASSPFKRSPPSLEPHLAFAYTITFEQLQDALNDEQRTKPNSASPHPSAQQVSAATSDPPRNLLVVDVREHNEIKQFGAMPGTVSIPLSEFEAAFTTISGAEFERRYGISRPLPGEAGAHNEIILHCRSGKRSLAALTFLRWLGHRNVKHFGGGYTEWASRILEAN